MKNLLLLLSVTLLITITVNAQTKTPSVREISMQTNISPLGNNLIDNIIKNCSTMVRIGEMPNGDDYFLVTGIKKNSDDTSFYWIDSTMSVSGGGVIYDEVILCNSLRCGWSILFGNESTSFRVEKAVLDSKYKLTTTFSDGSRKIISDYNFKSGRLVFTSYADQVAIIGENPHINL